MADSLTVLDSPLDLQSIVTVTFDAPGSAEEESLNVFIQVNAICS